MSLLTNALLIGAVTACVVWSRLYRKPRGGGGVSLISIDDSDGSSSEDTAYEA